MSVGIVWVFLQGDYPIVSVFAHYVIIHVTNIISNISE